MRIQPFLMKPINNGTILSTYVAFMTQKLATGYEIDGVVILPRVELFHRHVPASLMYVCTINQTNQPTVALMFILGLTRVYKHGYIYRFSQFPNISSKNISAFSRAFRRACLTSDDTVRPTIIMNEDEIPESVVVAVTGPRLV